MNSNSATPATEASTTALWAADELAQAVSGSWDSAPAPTWCPTGICFESKFFRPGHVVIGSHEASRSRQPALTLQAASALARQGATAAILPRSAPATDLGIPVLRVHDPRTALFDLARHCRNRFRGQVIALTGSVGKTTTRTMLHSILAGDRAVFSTPHNYNLPSGVALSLASTPAAAEFAVYEVALGAPRSISESAALCRPDIAIVTGIAPVHLANRGTLGRIADEKALLFTGLAERGVAVINGDAPHFDRLEEIARAHTKRIVTFGTAPASDCRLISYRADDGGFVEADILGRVLTYRIGSPGRHLALNSLAVLASAAVLNIDLDRAVHHLATFHPPSGRGRREEIALDGKTVSVIDDAFNANPSSVRACLEVLATTPPVRGGRRIAVLGDMLELGSEEVQYHRELVEPILQAGVERVHVVGSLMGELWAALPSHLRGMRAKTLEELAKGIRRELQDGDVLAVKGSHATGISRLVNLLKSPLETEGSLQGRMAAPFIASSLATNAPSGPNADAAHRSLLRDRSLIIQSLDDGAVLKEAHADARHEPASLVKLMTLYLTFGALEIGELTLDHRLKVSVAAATARGSRLGLEAHSELLVHDAISGLIVVSANDAAVALAERLGTSVSAFVARMNGQARTLGLTNTVFRNPHGLSVAGQSTTARDILRLAVALLTDFPHQAHWFALRSFVFGGSVRRSTNKLLDRCAGLDGLKTGHTPTSGYHLAFTAERAGVRLVGVAMGYQDVITRDDAVANALESAFALKGISEPGAISSPQGGSGQTKKAEQSRTEKALHKEDGEAVITLLGDFYLGDYYMRWREERGRSNVLKEKGVDYCFANFRGFLGSADFNIVNLEAALTRMAVSPFAGQKSWILDADPESTLACLRQHNIGAVTLGNNHAADFGPESVRFSLEELSAHGVLRAGAGMNAEEAARPLALDVRIGERRRAVLVFSAYAFNEGYDRKYRYYAQDDSPGVAAIGSEILAGIAEARERDPEALIVFAPHWGGNYLWRSDAQAKLADLFIDAGVDLIIGHGAHMMQEIERTSGKWVAYSIGNFVFNNHGEYTKRQVPPFSLATRLIFRPKGSQLAATVNLYPFYCDNMATRWQPRWVDESEFSAVLERITKHLLQQHDPDPNPLRTGRDTYGFYIELPIDREGN